MSLSEKIIEIISESGVGYIEKSRTIYTRCPSCGRDDKFSVLKENGACICYRGSCDFGKKWFADWVSLTLNIPIGQAKKMIYDKGLKITPDAALDFDVNQLDKPRKNEENDLLKDLIPVDFPEFHMYEIDDEKSIEGLLYLNNRGVSIDLAKKFDIRYSSVMRRVVMPIKMNGKCYGYQARHIDKVPEKMRMRNNEGFRRDTLVMFADNLKNSDFAILAEGPFDAIKFNNVGGFVASMGKSVTDKQLKIIYSYGIKRLYLALDEDALSEMMDIAEKSPIETYVIRVPDACKQRCNILGKKADFGECTFEEAEEAFKNAQKIDISTLLL